jgi:transposase
LEEADACTESGQIGALLRREGLYSSHLTTWRRQREAGLLETLSPKKRGRNGKDEMERELVGLRRENERLQARLEQAETIIEVQKKLSHLLGLAEENGTGKRT